MVLKTGMLITAIRKKISSSATAIVHPASKVFQSIMMTPLITYCEEALAAYHSKLNQALEIHESTMADIGTKMQIQFAINGIQPSHFASLMKERVGESTDWLAYWTVSHALEEQFKQSDVITRAALAATSGQKRYSDEFKKLNPALPAISPVVLPSAKARPDKAAWVDRKPKVLTAERTNNPDKPYVDKPCINCGPRQGSRHILSDCKQTCYHQQCRDKPTHLAATCKLWAPVKHPKKANKTLQLVDPDEEYDYDAAEVSQNLPTALRAQSTPFPPVAGRGIRNIYDAGSNVFIGPHVPPQLHKAPITPVNERVQVADNSYSKISGTTIIGGSEFCIAPAFSDVLVPQSFVEK